MEISWAFLETISKIIGIVTGVIAIIKFLSERSNILIYIVVFFLSILGFYYFRGKKLSINIEDQKPITEKPKDTIERYSDEDIISENSYNGQFYFRTIEKTSLKKKPNIKADGLADFEKGQLIRWLGEKTEKKQTISNLTGHWYKVEFAKDIYGNDISPLVGWIFGGFLGGGYGIEEYEKGEYKPDINKILNYQNSFVRLSIINNFNIKSTGHLLVDRPVNDKNSFTLLYNNKQSEYFENDDCSYTKVGYSQYANQFLVDIECCGCGCYSHICFVDADNGSRYNSRMLQPNMSPNKNYFIDCSIDHQGDNFNALEINMGATNGKKVIVGQNRFASYNFLNNQDEICFLGWENDNAGILRLKFAEKVYHIRAEFLNHPLNPINLP